MRPFAFLVVPLLCAAPTLAFAAEPSPVTVDQCIATRQACQNLPDDQKQALRERMRAEREARMAAMTPEQRAEMRERRGDRMRAKWEEMTPEQKDAWRTKARERFAAMSPEQRAELRKLMDEAR